MEEYAGERGSTAQRDKPTAQRPNAPPTNLPAALTSFIGRSTELARVRELLGEARLLTLVGAGGCGKTRLAMQGLAAATGRFEDGVWWVDLAPLEDPRLLATTVASALGVRERPGQPTLEVLCEHFGERRAVLALDNCEHLLNECATLVDTLLHSCRALVVLATSREALAVPGELTYRVPSLSMPPESGPLATVTDSDAVRLFLDRADQARPGFELTEEAAPAVGAICRELDGMPLAIELAAARVRMLAPERIATELGDRFRLLTGGGRTVAARHETLRASIDWSHELCAEEERLLLRRLSVFVGGFTLDGAEAVGADELLERRAVLEPLTGLVDKCLIDTEERTGEVRFRMLETIRQYASERLTEAGEVDAANARHLAWCIELAERAEPELVRHDAHTWLNRLEAEAANLRAALERSAASDPEAALRLAAALVFFWLIRGRLEEGVTALSRALEGAPAPTAARGKALWGVAELNAWRGQLGQVIEPAERALADGEALGDSSVLARALKVQGLVRNLPDHLDRAALERSVELARDAGDEWCTADATRLVGASYVRQGEHETARPILEESYALARTLGHRPLHCWYFNLRAWGELEHGRLPAARELANQGLGLANQIGDPVSVGLATATLVECDVLEGRPREGRARGEPCLERMRTMGVKSAHVWLENALSLVDVAEGAAEEACARIEATLRLLETMPTHDTVSKARRRLAAALLLLGDLDGAAAEAERFFAHAQKGRHAHAEALARLLLGRVSLARGEVIDAEGHLHDALGIAAERDFRLHAVNALEALARIAALTDTPTEAARLLAAARSAREELGAVRWPPEPELWADVEREVRATLGDDAFATADAEGRALSLEEAVEYARRAHGKRRRPGRGWDSLTPTELEVVRHAAAGLTNPQIGERMFISRATVKAHLSHVFPKLGISSRSELAAEAARRGLDTPATADPTAR